MNFPTPQLLPLNPPSPLEFPMIFRGRGGGGRHGYFLEPHIVASHFLKKVRMFLFFFFEFYFIVVVHRTVAYEGIYVNLSSLSLLREPSALKLKEIKGTQHMICMKKQRFSSCLSARVVHLGPPGSALPA